MMELLHGFLVVDLDLWENRDDFRQANKTVKSQKVVHDHAEHGVSLTQEYSLLMGDESQLQLLQQVVKDHRQMYHDSRKQTRVPNKQ